MNYGNISQLIQLTSFYLCFAKIYSKSLIVANNFCHKQDIEMKKSWNYIWFTKCYTAVVESTGDP